MKKPRRNRSRAQVEKVLHGCGLDRRSGHFFVAAGPKAASCDVIETIVHELGHFWHLKPSELAGHKRPYNLAEIVGGLPRQRRQRSEAQARACNWSVWQKVDLEVVWTGPNRAVGADAPDDARVRRQAGTTVTKKVVRKIMKVLEAEGLIEEAGK